MDINEIKEKETFLSVFLNTQNISIDKGGGLN